MGSKPLTRPDLVARQNLLDAEHLGLNSPEGLRLFCSKGAQCFFRITNGMHQEEFVPFMLACKSGEMPLPAFRRYIKLSEEDRADFDLMLELCYARNRRLIARYV
jgi:hypothetical protein